ncbi:MAG: hypothetical protein RL204_134 [Bacteroidota bacterium]|jgi:hypothetical protein
MPIKTIIVALFSFCVYQVKAQNIFGPNESDNALIALEHLFKMDSIQSNCWHPVSDTIRFEDEYVIETWSSNSNEVRVRLELIEGGVYTILLRGLCFEISSPHYIIQGKMATDRKSIRSLKYTYDDKHCRVLNRDQKLSFRNRFIRKSKSFPEKSLNAETAAAIYNLTLKYLMIEV